MSITITGGVNFSGGSLFTVLSTPTVDTQFNYVTALFSGEGTNTAQNNTFVDGSTNNFTITRTGTPTQGSFSPYGSNWSNYFNGSTDYLSVPSNAAFGYGTGDFTIELWYYFTGTTSDTRYFFDQRTSAGGSQLAPAILLNAGVINVYLNGVYAIVGPTVTVNTWNHLALVRSSGVTKLYINGTQVGSSYTDANSYITSPMAIAVTPVAANTYNWSGYISNFRVVKGTAVYTSAFTPSTAPLAAIANTSLLTCQSNRFIDNSSNSFAITISGTPSVQRYNPFGTNTSYATSTISGSGYFNGSTDWLLTPSTGQFNPAGDFTIECWFYMPSLPGTYYELFGNYNANTATCWEFEITSTGVFNFYTNGGTPRISTASSAIKPNTWYHACMTRSGTTITGYINGVSVGTYTQSGSFGSATLPVYIASQSASLPFKGYISDARLVNGTCVYTSNFIPPAVPLTAISGTNLLLNFTNAGIYDSAMMNNAITVGAAQISTAQYKFGSSSISFNGTTSYLSNLNNSLNYAFGSGDFTIEFWLYASTLPTNPASAQLFDTRPASTNGAYPLIYLYYDGTIRFYVSSADRITSSTISTSTWYHVAVCRSSGSTKLFINGTQSGSTYTDATVYLAGNALIGASYSGNPTISNFLNGYLDDIRVTKGYARYTANFTAPTSAFITFGPTAAPSGPAATVQYLVVAGGGGGGGAASSGGGTGGGGGGAGGLLTGSTSVAAGSTMTVFVGTGGAGGTSNTSPTVGTSGGNSVISAMGINTVSATGGGGGGSSYPTRGVGNVGGSGGGSSYNIGALGIAGQGSNGGPTTAAWAAAGATTNNGYPAGGGGGAGGTGTWTFQSANGGNGGVGVVSTIISSANATTYGVGQVSGGSVYFAGGGGGGVDSGTNGTGGLGGGGNGNVAGTANTGGGGGGAAYLSAVNSTAPKGGNGVVILSTASSASATTGNPITTTNGGNNIYIFTSAGTITF
jgi:hypothetical protein